jgi:four helix bundle protein
VRNGDAAAGEEVKVYSFKCLLFHRFIYRFIRTAALFIEFVLEKLEVYLLAEEFSDRIWKIVAEWDYLKKDTIGKQLVRSADSISANIAEGYGRYFYKESEQFYFYSRGLIQETKAWLSKCKRRKIIDDITADELIGQAQRILAMLNAFIKFVAKPQNSSNTKNSAANTNNPINE